MKISEKGNRRRTLVSNAGSAICDAMIAFTTQNEGLSAWEWLKAFRDVEDRLMAEELCDEWEERE